jgi:hypothetical protein
LVSGVERYCLDNLRRTSLKFSWIKVSGHLVIRILHSVHLFQICLLIAFALVVHTRLSQDCFIATTIAGSNHTSLFCPVLNSLPYVSLGPSLASYNEVIGWRR